MASLTDWTSICVADLKQLVADVTNESARALAQAWEATEAATAALGIAATYRQERDTVGQQLQATQGAFTHLQLASNERHEQLLHHVAELGQRLEQERAEKNDALMKCSQLEEDLRMTDRKVARRDDRVEMAEAVAASAKIRLRLDAETRAAFQLLMESANLPHKESQKYLRLLIENQLSCLRNSSGRCVWHREVLDWCTDVYRANPAAYEHMAFGGFLKLPDADTCRKRAAKVQASAGVDPELYERLRHRVQNLSPQEREMALLFDEINVVGDIAFKVSHPCILYNRFF